MKMYVDTMIPSVLYYYINYSVSLLPLPTNSFSPALGSLWSSLLNKISVF